MSITEEFHFDNRGEVVRFPHLRKYFLTLVILLVAALAFGIGRLTGEKGTGVSINYNPTLLASPVVAVGPSPSPVAPSAGQVYASSKGSRYYYMNCKSTIVEKNKVTFASAIMAESAGYTLATGCKAP
jgi:hypothetical protein